MSRAPAHSLRTGTALLVLALAAATAIAAEIHGARIAIWVGAGCGALIGLLGHLFNLRAAAPSQAGGMTDPAEVRDRETRRWAAWGLGLLARFILLFLAGAVLWAACSADYQAAMFSLLAAYLTLHAWEIVRLCRCAAAVEKGGASA
ncbi:MAG TPA: hypothetical protein PK280_08755 [Planctomycetota bacterium]|nr:hypothetical protein [Planctomycetota bacterium]